MGDLAANALRLLGHGENSLFQAVNGLYAFATDQQVVDETVSGLKYSATHLPELYYSAVSFTTDSL